MKAKKCCIGCGVALQDSNMMLEGYTSSLDNDICSRCFKLKNYGEYQVITKSDSEYVNILKEVNKTNDLVLYIVDLLNVMEDIAVIRNYVKNKMILVLTKRDVLPLSINDEKVINNFKQMISDVEDIIIISPKNNYNIDKLLKLIKKHQVSNNVYVVGYTNAGKSTLINTLMKNYSENECELTISPLPATTLNRINIKLNDKLTLIDTPGMIDKGSITNYIDPILLKKINPKKEIKPRTFQIKKNTSLLIGDLVRIDYIEGEKNSFTVYVSNDIKVKRINSKRDILKNSAKRDISVKYYEDLVIDGLGFIRIIEKANVSVYTNINVNVHTRKTII